MIVLLIVMALIWGLSALTDLYRVEHPRIKPYSAGVSATSALVSAALAAWTVYALVKWV